MKRWLTCLATLALVACQHEATQQTTSAKAAKTTTVARPQNLGQAKVNAVLPMNAAEGLVQTHLGSAEGTDKTTFKASEPIVVTVAMKDAPKGVEFRTQWFDAKNRQLAVERKELAGQNSATFQWKGKPLKPGQYRVVTYWGENVAGDHKFTVTK